MPVSSKPRARPRPAARTKPLKTRPELEALIAERFGVPVAQVVVRGDPPEWDATLIVPRSGNAEKHGRFWTLVYGMKGEFGLRG